MFLKTLWCKLRGKQKSKPASNDTIQAGLEQAQKEHTMIKMTRLDRTEVHGIFIKQTDQEIILKDGNDFVGVEKGEIAVIGTYNEQNAGDGESILSVIPEIPSSDQIDSIESSPEYENDSTDSWAENNPSTEEEEQPGFSEGRDIQEPINDQMYLVGKLRSCPQVDSKLPWDKSFEDYNSFATLADDISKNKWVFYYDGKSEYLTSKNVPTQVFIPPTVRASLSKNGYYLCSIAADQVYNSYPYLELIEAEYITQDLADRVSPKKGTADDVVKSSTPAGPRQRHGHISAYHVYKKDGFVLEGNMIWKFNDKSVKDPALLQNLHDGAIGQHVLFEGEDTVSEGKTYPDIKKIRAVSSGALKKQPQKYEEKKIKNNEWASDLPFLSDYAIREMEECLRKTPRINILQTIEASNDEDADKATAEKEKYLDELMAMASSEYDQFKSRKFYAPRNESRYYLAYATFSAQYKRKSPGKIREYLGAYFELQAEASIADGLPGEVVRFFSVEALRLFEDSQCDAHNKDIQSLYLLFLSYAPSLGNPEGPKTEEDIHVLVSRIKRTQAMDTLLSDLPYYSRELRPYLNGQAGFALNRILDSMGRISHSRTDNVSFGIQTLHLCQSIKPISESSLNQTYDSILDILKESKSNHLSDFEQQRYYDFLNIFSTLVDYSQKKDFSGLEMSKFKIDQTVNVFLQDYRERPTLLLAEALVPALNHLKNILDADFQKILDSTPNISVENILEMEGNVLTPRGKIELKLSVCNNSYLAPPIDSIELSLKDRPCQDNYSPCVLEANQRKEVNLVFTPSKSEIEDQAFSVNVLVSFRTRKGEKQAGPFLIPIRLDQKHSEKIPNPYLRYAGGIPIAADDNQMFFGRKELVEEICEQLSQPYSGQCYILYGQKRSGKTSVMQRIKNNLPADAFYTHFTAQGLNYDQPVLLSAFAKRLLEEVQEVAEDRSIQIPDIQSFKEQANEDPFLALKHVSSELKGQNLNWIVSVDEFTCIYTDAQEKANDFMHKWKALLQDHVFNALIIGQDTMPQFKQAFPNDFCVSHERRLTFLNEEDSMALASKPIEINGTTRYKGKSLSMVYQKTAGSPFFLQKICSETVKYLKRKGAAYITEADIDRVSYDMVHGRADCSLRREDFDALVVAGDPKLSLVPEETLWKVLTAIAIYSWNKGWCSFSELDDIPDYRKAINDLQDRDTIEVNEENVRIRVELFADWLRINNKGMIE